MSDPAQAYEGRWSDERAVVERLRAELAEVRAEVERLRDTLAVERLRKESDENFHAAMHNAGRVLEVEAELAKAQALIRNREVAWCRAIIPEGTDAIERITRRVPRLSTAAHPEEK